MKSKHFCFIKRLCFMIFNAELDLTPNSASVGFNSSPVVRD